MASLDILIVGAGIAGLHIATELQKRSPDLKIQIVEKYKNAGGRMETVHLDKIQYESGAGRIHSSHKMLLKLIKQHGLTTTDLKPTLQWRSELAKVTENDDFFAVFKDYCEVLSSLPKAKLQNTTIRDLLIEFQGVDLAKQLLNTYPYRAELEIMSADSALDLFNSLSTGKFLILNEGFSELVQRIQKNLFTKIKFDHEIQRIEYNSTKKIYNVSGIHNKKPIQITAKRVILALPQKALEKIYPFSPDHPLLKKVRMEPLLRIYSIYKNSSWFPNSSIVTDSPLRYIIPIDRTKGVIMSSYTDARDTEPWLEFTKHENLNLLKDRIQDETQNLFPELTIPKSQKTTPYLWKDGCSYWLPGHYDYREASKQALYPMPEKYPNLHIVGESFSKKQQWIEGALEHADELVESLHLD
jgi:protoporphyrinogen oxidase